LTAKVEDDNFDQFYFIQRSSPAAKSWIQKYFQMIPHSRITHALRMMQKSRLQHGFSELKSIGQELAQREKEAEDQVLLASRWYYSVLAYHQYRLEQFSESMKSLDLAQSSVRMAVERCKFLLPFLSSIEEFQIQRARISREQRQWETMAGYVDHAQSLVMEHIPICIFSDGQVATFDMIREFYESIPQLSDQERSSDIFRYVMDVGFRLQKFNNLVQHLYILPGFVIPYGMLQN
jgi:hypothetical protein